MENSDLRKLKLEIHENDGSSSRIDLEGEYIEIQEHTKGITLIGGSFIQTHKMIDIFSKYFLINNQNKKLEIIIGSCRLDAESGHEIAVFEGSGNFT